MDLATMGGLLIGLLSLIFGFILEGGVLGALIAPTAALIVFGGTFGATAMSFSMEELKTLPFMLKKVFTRNKQENLVDLIELIIELSIKSRKEGLLVLEAELSSVENLLLKKGLTMAIDATSVEDIRRLLERETMLSEQKYVVGASIFEAAGGFAPTMGIIGTVMGLIHVLGNLADPSKLGESIASAFLATLYGISSANILWLPLAAKLANLSRKQITVNELVIEGVTGIMDGISPAILRDRLEAFIRETKQMPAQGKTRKNKIGGLAGSGEEEA